MLKASKIITIDGDKSFAPVKNAPKVALIEPKHFLPMIKEPTTKVTAIKTILNPKSAKNGTIEKISITANADKNSADIIFTFL